ncbi:MAG: hypothetical protein J7598_09040 [Mitsuaria chitosanitabida]|uniref:hypothetical protein n=1 Tax=Roseateles chitosanitabidus TaxID=65048 RepID=UPI001B269E77|nr:hypothetical protein [Roseateles chitosanitabidus]MBO9686746.1 hypothetical protein [Roseateles chitosanitabidus]
MTPLVERAYGACDLIPPPIKVEPGKRLDAFDVIPGPYSETARWKLESLNRKIRLRDARPPRAPEQRNRKGVMAHDFPEQLLALYLKYPHLLEPPPGGGDMKSWPERDRDEDRRR